MIFQEHTLATGFNYTIEDVFGAITIRSARKLTGANLDLIVSGILNSGAPTGTIAEGIDFTFTKAPTFLPDEPVKLKKGQCPECHAMKAYPLPAFVAAMGFVLIGVSPIAFILFLPLGILMLIGGFIALFLGPIAAAIAKPGHVFCMECKTTSKV
jgi:hypothetical protein